MRNICLAVLLKSSILCSCGTTFDTDPERVAYNAFTRHEHGNVNALLLKSWIESAPGTGRYRKFPYVAVEVMKREVRQEIRMEVAQYYVDLYLSIKHGDDRRLPKSILYNNWNEVFFGFDVSLREECLPTFRGVVEVNLKRIRDGGERIQGEQELAYIASKISE